MEAAIANIIRVGIQEDLGDLGDVTTLATIPDHVACRAVLLAKSPGVLAGRAAFAAVFAQLDTRIRCEWDVDEGARVEAGTVVGRVAGPARPVLSGERLALNVMQRMSGIATQTRAMAERIAARGANAVLLDTRKTAPGLRALDRAAVVTGGGRNHRRGLYDAVLIKDNHVAVAGGITAAVDRAQTYLEGIGRRRMDCVVEARTLDEVDEVVALARAGRPVSRILLDNMVAVADDGAVDTGVLREAVARVAGALPTEASGNVTLATVADVADAGVDFISCGALTHSVQAMDLSLKIAMGQ